MTGNRYSPPVAVVCDVADEMDPPRPRQVIWAVRLLWATMILWVFQDGFSVLSSPASVIAVHAVLTSLTVAVAGFVYLCVYRRKNWSRILVLIWTIVSTAAVLFVPSYSSDSTLERVITAAKATTDVVCVYLLFASPASTWFKKRRRQPWATGRKNWLFAGTLAAVQRAAVIMSLIQTAKLNGHDPYAYLKDVLTRLPTQIDRDIDQLLPHRWKPTSTD